MRKRSHSQKKTSHSNTQRLHYFYYCNLKAHKFVQQGVFFLALFSCTFDDQLSLNCHRFIILCICWDTPSENTGLYQRCPVPLFWDRLTLLVLMIKNKNSCNYHHGRFQDVRPDTRARDHSRCLNCHLHQQFSTRILCI